MSIMYPRLRQDRTFGVLNGGITASQTSASITPDAASLPLPAVVAPNIFVVILEPDTVNEEIVWITSCSASATSGFTMLRGQEGSASVSHLTGVPYKHGPTTQDFNSTIRDAAWLRATTANVNDDEFNAGVLDPSWIQVVPTGTQSVVVGADVCSVKVAGQTPSDVCGLVKPINGLAIGNSIETSVRGQLCVTQYPMCGLVLCDGTSPTSNIVFANFYDLNLLIYSGAFNGVTYNPGSAAVLINIVSRIFIRLLWVAANTFRAYYSPDGVQWSTFGIGDLSLAMTPTHMGLMTGTYSGAGDYIASFEYFRVN